MRILPLLALMLTVTSCDNMKVKVVTDSEITKQIDLLTQNGPWQCEGEIIEDDGVNTPFTSIAVYSKTGPDNASEYTKVNATISMTVKLTAAMSGTIQIEEAGTLIGSSQVIELQGIELTPQARLRLPTTTFGKQRVATLLQEARTSFALQSKEEFSKANEWQIKELTKDKLVGGDETSSMSCTHAEAGLLFTKYGLIVK
jgi:hypothetical protein